MRCTFSQQAAPRRVAGFTLIELMIVVAIAAVLAVIAVPAYQNSVMKSRRTTARTALLDLASREERFYTTNNSYTTTPGNLGYAAFPVAVPGGNEQYYNVTVTAADATSFTLTAAPINAQAADSCGTYSLNQLGQKTVSGGTLSADTCWN